jgi:glycosyltransferase involved in cell wall biosynthesis
MEYIKELIARVNKFDAPLHERYPELLKKTTGKKILFMSPILNKQGLYRMIFPAVELQVAGKFSCIVSNVVPDNCNLTIDDFNVKIQPELIQWADYVVFAANGQDMASLVPHLKEINPEVKIVMDVDRIYHRLGKNNYASIRFRQGNRLKFFVNNLSAVDIVTFADKMTEDFYLKMLAGTGVRINSRIVPNLLSPHLFAGINFKEERKLKERKTILIISDGDDFDDINSFRQAIEELVSAFPDADIKVLGNCVNFEDKNPLRFVKCEKITYKDLTEYYRQLYDINADICLVPIKKEIVPNYRPYYKLLELASFGVPIVSMNEYPFNHLLVKDSMILLSGNKRGIISSIKYLFFSEEERTKLWKSAQRFVLQNYIFSNPKMFRTYEDLFI